MEFDRHPDGGIADAVATGHAEGRLVRHIGCDALRPPADRAVLADIDQRDAPRPGRGLQRLHGPSREIDREIRNLQAVIQDVPLGLPVLSSEADDVGRAMRGVDLHDVPEDRCRGCRPGSLPSLPRDLLGLGVV
jgi:hypothetical protein